MPRRLDYFHTDGTTIEHDHTAVDEDATVAERFANCEARLAERMPDIEDGVRFLMMVCDGCGLHVQVDKPELPEGWTSQGNGDDFCEACS